MDSMIKYKNGNTWVSLNLENGTRILETEDDEFLFDTPVNIDCKITNKCPFHCSFCHENSTPDGEQANFEEVVKVLSTLPRGTEIALGGGALTSIDFDDFCNLLSKLKDCGLIVNATFHEKEILMYHEQIRMLQKDKLLYGIGVSIPERTGRHTLRRLASYLEGIDNVVFHVIAGVVSDITLNELRYTFKNLKILILGYKNFRRGTQYLELYKDDVGDKIESLRSNIVNIMKSSDVVSFDDLALIQLNIKDKVTEDVWDACYQGSDTRSGMYIDFVKNEFACNSTSTERYSLMNNVKDMFDVVKMREDDI